MTDVPTLLVADDDPMMRDVVDYLLRDGGGYRTRLAACGADALALAVQPPLPSLLLLDVNMPDMDGYEVCRRIKQDPRLADVPVIFLSSAEATDDVLRGFAVGAADYVTKPVVPPILLARIASQLQLREARAALVAQNQSLESLVEQRTADLSLTQELTIAALGALAETRDNDTGNHIYRTQAYVRLLVEAFAAEDPARIAAAGGDGIWKSAPLHDVGKIGIPDAILLKPGRLTPEEFGVMQTHARLGREALRMAEDRLGVARSFLYLAADIAGSHHERWDGGGYPDRLAGEAIPFCARLMAVADVYDAMISRRVYKDAGSHEEALAVIREGRGSHFDPEVVDRFIARRDRILDIAERFRDG